MPIRSWKIQPLLISVTKMVYSSLVFSLLIQYNEKLNISSINLFHKLLLYKVTHPIQFLLYWLVIENYGLYLSFIIRVATRNFADVESDKKNMQRVDIEIEMLPSGQRKKR